MQILFRKLIRYFMDFIYICTRDTSPIKRGIGNPTVICHEMPGNNKGITSRTLRIRIYNCLKCSKLQTLAGLEEVSAF